MKGYSSEKPAEWSEEDEKIANEILDYLNTKNAGWFSWFNDRFKSLRPQPQRRDTYYDIIHSILTMLKDKDFTQITPEHRISILNDIRVKCIHADEWAKILDESLWKPTEEQMKVFLKATPVNLMLEELSIYHSLYEELKKL